MLYRLAALWNPKAAQWANGRKEWRRVVKRKIDSLPQTGKRIWIHVASLGEFEQGRPLIERLRKDYPQYQLILTFFSPSGYEIRKDYDQVDAVFYLPVDGPLNARDFIDRVQPSLVLFIKYEFWHYYLKELKQRQIPVFLVAAAFMPHHSFFQWYGQFFRNMLKAYNIIFVQDVFNKDLLATINITENVLISGDTRYDRVAAIADRARTIPEIDAFKGDAHLLVGGSTWPDDEALLAECLPQLPANWKLVIAPHEIDAPHIKKVEALFGNEAVTFSAFNTTPDAASRRVLIIDNMGMLASLYRYGSLAWIGGGFHKSGIHNILEPAVFGNPVIIGPEYRNFVEAIRFVKEGYALCVTDRAGAEAVLARLTSDSVHREALAEQIRGFMRQNIGATDRVLATLAKNNWL